MLAPSTLNMFPKFELAPILMYFVMFAKTLRPSVTPRQGRAGSFRAELLQALGGLGRRQAFRRGLQFRAGFAGLKAAEFRKHPIMDGGLRTGARARLDRFREDVHGEYRWVWAEAALAANIIVKGP
ncbi:hypothetical protein [Bradyrhizobium erythrophlei]|jgi:hypothetical protein|uniref:hypothetical protein n=1 Tax=Bradyrhizobium erythrophlei TaxID=1437360 RepID=UPI0030B856BC